MSDAALHPPADFEGLVRDALIHLYDLVGLQAHPLLAIAALDGPDSAFRAKRLRQDLLDAIEALQPNADPTAADRSGRAHRILELRYIEGRDVEDVIAEVNLSKSQYHREHHRALAAVTLLLWERWRLAERRPNLDPPHARPGPARPDLAQAEARELVAADAANQVNPWDVVRGICELLGPLCDRQGVRLKLDRPVDVAPIAGERVALRQALLAILAHAVKAARRATLELTVATRSQRVEISIRGPAGDAADPVRLGLPESRRFVEALQGRLTLRPASAADGRWTIDLSFHAADRATLLVVDNHGDFIHLVERYLVGRRWDVVGAPDVDRAYALACDRRPAAILLDVVMPGRDGWDLLVDLKATPVVRDIPVIICSVLDEPEVARSLGAAAYLQKPVQQQHLIAALDDVIGQGGRASGGVVGARQGAPRSRSASPRNGSRRASGVTASPGA